jgi:PAS domain S-box-containing protein
MLPILIFLVILSLLVVLLSGWRRDRRLLGEARSALQVRGAKRTNELAKANEVLKRAQAELQRRWQYLAEAQRLSHSGTFGWKVSSGELVWSDETYRILGFTRETNPTLDLVFDRIHPEDVDRVRQLSHRAAQNGMDLDVEHRILLPDGVIKYVHAVAHAGRDSSGNLEYMGVVTDITERKRAEEERQALSRNLQESKARLEEAQRVAHMGHYYWDLIANRVTWSDELYRIYGLTPQEGPIVKKAVEWVDFSWRVLCLVVRTTVRAWHEGKPPMFDFALEFVTQEVGKYFQSLARPCPRKTLVAGGLTLRIVAERTYPSIGPALESSP